MTALPLLSIHQIDQLLSGEVISDAHPWATRDEQIIEQHLKAACAAVSGLAGVSSRIEWGHYGSGYASFVDAWFYKTGADFEMKTRPGTGQHYVGLVVLLSRLSPWFVFMQGEKHWHARGGGSYLPDPTMLDHLTHAGVLHLAQAVQPVLENLGFVRARRGELSQPLPPDKEVPTILTSGPFTQFDALFYWED